MLKIVRQFLKGEFSAVRNGKQHDALRAEVRARREGRARDPSAAAIDSQAVKQDQSGGPERGYDGAKRLSGCKRHILVEYQRVCACRARTRRRPPGAGRGRRRLLWRRGWDGSCPGWRWCGPTGLTRAVFRTWAEE